MTPVEIVISVFFWLCVVGVAYAYVGYPVAAWALGAAFGRRREPPARDHDDVPFVSVLITAHNEEDVIADRIANALALEYWPDRFEIIVASDGSTDRTVYLVRRT